MPSSVNDTSLIGLHDGSLLSASSVRIGSSLRVQLRCGLRLATLTEIDPVQERLVSFVRPANPAVRYVSDLKPAGFKHIPLLSYQWPWRADRNVLGGPISSVGQLHEKGVGMHSTSRLAFELPAGYDQFQAEVALDQSTGQQGSVVFRVFTNASGAEWNSDYTSEIVRGGMKPVPVRVKLHGAKRLALVVGYADRGDQLDRANWIGARLVRFP